LRVKEVEVSRNLPKTSKKRKKRKKQRTAKPAQKHSRKEEMEVASATETEGFFLNVLVILHFVMHSLETIVGQVVHPATKVNIIGKKCSPSLSHGIVFI